MLLMQIYLKENGVEASVNIIDHKMFYNDNNKK